MKNMAFMLFTFANFGLQLIFYRFFKLFRLIDSHGTTQYIFFNSIFNKQLSSILNWKHVQYFINSTLRMRLYNEIKKKLNSLPN